VQGGAVVAIRKELDSVEVSMAAYASSLEKHNKPGRRTVRRIGGLYDCAVRATERSSERGASARCCPGEDGACDAFTLRVSDSFRKIRALLRSGVDRPERVYRGLTARLQKTGWWKYPLKVALVVGTAALLAGLAHKHRATLGATIGGYVGDPVALAAERDEALRGLKDERAQHDLAEIRLAGLLDKNAGLLDKKAGLLDKTDEKLTAERAENLLVHQKLRDTQSSIDDVLQIHRKRSDWGPWLTSGAAARAENLVAERKLRDVQASIDDALQTHLERLQQEMQKADLTRRRPP
jgi:hypothetical protein